MKKDTLFLIIAALTLYLTWRMFRIKKAETGSRAPEKTPLPEGLIPRPWGNPDGGEAEDTLTEEVSVEKCPYCGTYPAEVLRVKNAAGDTVKFKLLMCPNKSCPGSMGGKVTPLAKSKSAKLVTAR